MVPAARAVPLPDGISAELGASLGVPAMTAHRCLFADGPVEGKTVLVAGGAGAVGHFAIELARFSGARVITTVRGPEKAELARKAGADLVVNYREPSAAEEISSLGQVDRVIELAIGANLGLDLAVVRPGGEIVTYAAEPADPALPVRRCRSANVVLRSCCCTACLGCARARRARHHGGADRHAGRRPGHLIIHKAIPFTEEETRGGAEPCGRDEDLICVSLTKPAWRGILVTAAKDGRARGSRYGYAVDRSTLAQLDGHGALLSVAGNARPRR